MNAIVAHLVARIRAEGPLPVSTYMHECLLNPRHGYYTAGDPFGPARDFVTAPEVSQMFGELLGLCLVQAWRDQGRPARPVLAELGPGRGTLMADVMRVARKVSAFEPDLHLVEASPRMRARQSATLARYSPVWHRDVHTLPRGRPVFVLANEFFDALPVRQYRRVNDGWEEVMVGSDANAGVRLVARPAARPATLSGRTDVPVGGIVEVCASALAIVRAVCARLIAAGGAALILDYGGWRSLGDTVQALYRRKPDPILAHPGQADLSAHVDFEPLARAATDAGVRVLGPLPQGLLLNRLGIGARARVLARGLSGTALARHIAAHRRLTAPDQMGTLFKALALVPVGAPALAGFACDAINPEMMR